jgi:N-acyl-L-homoserine lactone synthetase
MIETYSHAQLADRPDRAHQLFSQRYEIFVRRLGWELPTRGFYEFDEFDHDGTAYILTLDEQNRLSGSCRMLPTTSAYMLSEIFGALLGNQPPPRSPGILELSRFCIDTDGRPARSPGENCPITTELFAAMVDCTLRQEATEVLAVVTPPILRIIRRLIGGEPDWRGPLQELDGVRSVAIRFRVSDRLLARLCAELGAPLAYATAPETTAVMRAA